MYTTYSWVRGHFDDEADEDELSRVNEKLKGTISKINKKSYIISQRNWQYFPHVQIEDLKAGFYKKFEQLQGHHGLYYATTLSTFEIMNEAIRAGEDLAEKYF